ncbi:hypothetical protein [Rhizobium leguminosarum]|nr:hypothetical protein [Rhizobium leguminosarum]
MITKLVQQAMPKLKLMGRNEIEEAHTAGLPGGRIEEVRRDT